MNSKIILTILTSFILGAIFSTMTFSNTEIPQLEAPSLSSSRERLSPSDTITEDQIRVYKNGAYIDLQHNQDEWMINLDLKNPTWSTFLDTNSMDPIFDIGANTIRIQVACPTELHEGDIVSYDHAEYGIVIHRIVVKDQDEQGPYFVLKGDNNPTSDPGKVRCEQILGKVVAIIY